MNRLFDIYDNGAEFSECKKYRYALWRIWDKNKPLIMFVGLNPSIANEMQDDPTIRRVKKFAFDWGYGGFYMTNLFAFITPYPNELLKCNDPVGNNDKWLDEIAEKCEKIIFCWGSFPEAKKRAKIILKKYKGFALEINKDGSPKHPLYIKSNVRIVKLNT